MTRSLRHRLSRRGVSPYVWLPIPVIHPHSERLKRAALGDHECRPYTVMLEESAQ